MGPLYRWPLAIGLVMFASGCASARPPESSPPPSQQIKVGRACPELAKLVEEDPGQHAFFEVVALDEPAPSPRSTWPRGKAVQSRHVAGLLVRDGASAEAPWRTSASQSAQEGIPRIRIVPKAGDDILLEITTPRSERHEVVALVPDQQPVLASVGAEQVVVTRYRLGRDLRVGLSALAECRDLEGPPRVERATP